MEIKDLKTLLKTLRSNGVMLYKTPELELQLAPEALLPQGKPDNIQADPAEIPSDDRWSNFPDGELTQEQLMFYSAGGRPEDDPQNENN